MTSLPRLFVDADLGPWQIVLGRTQSHYLATVMRRKAGDGVLVFNGRAGEWRAEIVDAAKKGVTLHIREKTREQAAEPGPWLLFAPVKRGAIDLVAEKATELGAQCLWPVVTERTNAARVKAERLLVIAREAAEQSGRLTVPEIKPAAPLAEVMDGWSGPPVVVFDETGGGGAVAQVLDRLTDPPAFVIGPEGGFARSELDFLGKLPFVNFCSLGRRLLRAETAALAALASWQAVAGDWRRP